METIASLFRGGINGLTEYLSAHVITCLVPALFIAGAIAAFVSQAAVLRYFGPQTKKPVSYGVASVSGAVLAVCSCTVLPLFAGIYKKGAGLGPAIAFLFSGPAINVLAIVYSAKLLGFDIGFARAIGAIAFSVIIGLIMAFIYRKEKSQADAQAFAMLASDPAGKSIWQQVLFIGSLVGVLVFAASKNWIVMVIFLAAAAVILWRWFTKGEIVRWLKETLHFTRLIIPWLLVGVFIAGILTVVIPQSIVTRYVGGNSLPASFIASFAGALMYFATLTEVPIIRAFMDLGMGKGPALALLLAGPALSLPSMLVIRNVMGTKKMLTYVALVVVMATTTGYVFGLIA
ncbi:MAG: permease [Dehalococcoidia bacterium]|nr:MAG: permease [Dehalococcoidia bacterium]